MKMARNIFTSILILFVLLLASATAFAATDNFYQPVSVPDVTWDGTDASRLKAASLPDYDFIYGDDSILTYNLPWTFIYYGQSYTKIYVDTNGNIWFANSASASSFDLTNTGKGPVIAAWNNDLSSQYYGGAFIQRKTNPERVVIEWKTETFSEEGVSSLNNFETVLFPNGDIRIDYKSFFTQNGMGSGSGISKGDGTAYSNTATLPNTSFQFKMLPLLIVSKAGSGAGTVTSVPTGTSCGTDCNVHFVPGTPVTLTATPDSDSTFVGWSGACTGTGTCQVTMNDNKAVTATFKIIPPVAAFSASPASGGTPFIATITDQSQRAASWSWTFGDGATSTERNTSHIYKTPGTYTVTLSVTNASGTSTTQKNITVYTCQNQPVKIQETNANYPSLTAALGAAIDGQTIRLQDWYFLEDAIISKSVTLDGGYDCGYTNKTGLSVLEGEVHTTGGTVRMKDVRIAGTTPSTLPAISVAPVSDSFGSVYVNSASGAHSFTIGNSGGANLTIGAIVLSGANFGEFAITADACTGKALTPGTSCAAQAAFAPTSTGARTAVLAVTSNDPATPTKNVTMNGIGTLPKLSILKAGTGSGSVSSSPAGISCGSGCSSDFMKGTSVTLTAFPVVDSSFDGWSGGCSGTSACTVAMNADISVTATFNKRTSVASFNVTPASGGAPLFVGFTDTSQFATSWLWNFGDGTTSNVQNPSHIYKTPGTYTTNLTASNASSSTSTSKIITVNACGTLPVKIGASYFSTLQAAYNAAADGNTIQSLALDFAENLAINRAISVTLEGGYMCDYSANPPGMTTIKGEPHTSDGIIKMRNFQIR